MAQKYLITQTDIKVYRPAAELDDERIKPFILEAQNTDLKPVLNNALFYDFITNFDDTLPINQPYTDLLNGKEWTIDSNVEFFEGVKPMLCYYALARFIEGNPFHVTRFGVVTKIQQQSEKATPEEIRMICNGLRSSAISYQNDVIRFLENNPTNYPLYNTAGASNNAARRTSFNFFKL